MAKNLVIFFSLTGNTHKAAEMVAEGTDADLVELKPIKPYPSGFSTYLLGGFQAVFNLKPGLQPLAKDLAEYDIIFLGTPVWAGKISPPLRAFLSAHDLAGRKLALFCTCLDNAGKAFANINKLQPQVIPAGQITLNMKPEFAAQSLQNVSKWADEIAGQTK